MCNAEAHRSEVCIADGAFTWQTKSLNSADTEGSTVDHSSDGDALVTHEAVMANDAHPTLTDINFTVPKVFNHVLRYYSMCIQ